jgi:hypothetical protein
MCQDLGKIIGGKIIKAGNRRRVQSAGAAPLRSPRIQGRESEQHCEAQHVVLAALPCRDGEEFCRAPITPKTSPNDGDIPRRRREIWRFKNRANIDNRGNREIREIRETGKLPGGRVWVFRVFRVFRGSENFLGEDLVPRGRLDLSGGCGQYAPVTPRN